MPKHAPMPASKEFPKNVEPRGNLRFGPAPTRETPVRQNIFNRDRFGRAKPGQRK